ncbi:MAG: DNA polymerase III subunit beta [Oscillospiraceae bacterium]|nr:DNA polymerase III subunit beta [Oscillospiraceae bacterium]
MKFTCEKYVLQNALNTASRAAAQKSTVPALEGLLIEAVGSTVRISGYDMKIGITTSIPADIEQSGGIVLNSRLFCDIIRKMPDDIVSISADESYMTRIKCAMSDYEIMGTAAEDYPELPTVDSTSGINVPQGMLKSMIAQTNFAVSDNESRPIHMGELFDIENGTLTVVAVDGYRLALRREELSDESAVPGSFVVPGTALSEVEKIAEDTQESLKITVGLKHIMFTVNETVLITRRLEGEFLNYKNSIPQTGKYHIKADKRKLIDAVERVSLIISDKLKSPVRCTFRDNVVSMLTNTTLGKASDEVEVEGDGENLEIGFNNKYLLDALKAAPADEVCLRLTSGVTPCVVLPTDDSRSFVYMILPVRLKSNEG